MSCEAAESVEDAVLRMARVNSNVFLVRIASGQPAKQAKKRGARVRERDKERKTSDAEGGICFSRAGSRRGSAERESASVGE